MTVSTSFQALRSKLINSLLAGEPARLVFKLHENFDQLGEAQSNIRFLLGVCLEGIR